jgi:hypothetical protein
MRRWLCLSVRAGGATPATPATSAVRFRPVSTGPEGATLLRHAHSDLVIAESAPLTLGCPMLLKVFRGLLPILPSLVAPLLPLSLALS